jgi:hypothetical protein
MRLAPAAYDGYKLAFVQPQFLAGVSDSASGDGTQ